MDKHPFYNMLDNLKQEHVTKNLSSCSFKVLFKNSVILPNRMTPKDMDMSFPTKAPTTHTREYGFPNLNLGESGGQLS